MENKIIENFSVLLLVLFAVLSGVAQAYAEPCGSGVYDDGGDPNYEPEPFLPAQRDQSPALLFDEGHHNFYTLTKPAAAYLVGKYKPFAQLAQADGFEVSATKRPLDNLSQLQKYGVIVIVGASAVAEYNASKSTSRFVWNPKVGESALTENELNTLVAYVKKGGSLFLGSNHAPLTDPLRDLLALFGVRAKDSTVLPSSGPIALNSHSPLVGATRSFATAGGGALHPTVGTTLVRYAPSVVAYGDILPFISTFPYLDFKNYSYALESGLPVLHVIDANKDLGWPGAGRIAIGAHAGDFTSKIEYCNGKALYDVPDGMLKKNQQITLNVLRWLAGHR